jgi:hypothetical protein
MRVLKRRKRIMRKKTGLSLVTLALALCGAASIALAQSNECLVQFEDSTGVTLADGAELCQTAAGRICSFDLQLCLNAAQPGCAPSSFQKRKFRASGHCGPVGRLKVNRPSGSEGICGQPATIKVRTRGNGKHPGRCTIRAAVQTAASNARKDVDTVALVCQPPSGTCPTTTTTSTTTTTTLR